MHIFSLLVQNDLGHLICILFSYWSWGGEYRTLPVREAFVVDILERNLTPLELLRKSIDGEDENEETKGMGEVTLKLKFKAFEVMTLKLLLV